jgi:hypothetical protein
MAIMTLSDSQIDVKIRDVDLVVEGCVTVPPFLFSFLFASLANAC